MNNIPTPADYAGGLQAFEKLTECFYKKVALDSILSPVFAEMDEHHAQYVAAFLTQCFGGGAHYSGEGSENDAIKAMVEKHLGRYLTEVQRRKWVEVLMDAADEVGLPNDPEFRSAFAAKIEWGSRIALMNSQLEENPVGPDDHIPRFGWGSVKGPWESVGSICTFETSEEIIH